MKTCTLCKIEKSSIEFNKKTSYHDGLSPWCKECKKLKDKGNYQKNKDKIKNNALSYYEKNKLTVLTKRKNNPDYKKYNQEYKLKNLKKISLYNKEYRNLNREKIKKQRKLYRKNHRIEISQYENNRYKINILANLAKKLRNRTNELIRNKNWKKTKKLFEYLGCDLTTLMIHLEKNFSLNMTWDNYGEWQIDHIIPLSSAKTEEELYKLSHYTNLQPMWAIDNQRKNNKL